MPDCRHLRISSEAVAISEDGRETPVLAHLCAFQIPVAVPRWIERRCGGNLIRPEVDCVDCSAFAPEYLVRPA